MPAYLKDICITEISLVDKAANKRIFIYKAKDKTKPAEKNHMDIEKRVDSIEQKLDELIKKQESDPAAGANEDPEKGGDAAEAKETEQVISDAQQIAQAVMDDPNASVEDLEDAGKLLAQASELADTAVPKT